jgi:hypothetical protein
MALLRINPSERVTAHVPRGTDDEVGQDVRMPNNLLLAWVVTAPHLPPRGGTKRNPRAHAETCLRWEGM